MSDHPTRPKPLDQMGEVELNQYVLDLGGSPDGAYTLNRTYLRSVVVERILALENAAASVQSADASSRSARWAGIASAAAAVAAVFAALAWMAPRN